MTIISVFEFVITNEETCEIRNLIQNIPNRDTFLHGDYRSKNIMVRNSEFQLIDIDSANIGHPVFDIAVNDLIYLYTSREKAV